MIEQGQIVAAITVVIADMIIITKMCEVLTEYHYFTCSI